MRLTILAVIVAVIVSAGTAYIVTGPSSQLSAASASSNTQSTILFDTSRIIELLKQLLSIRNSAAPAVTIPFATTTPAKQAVATTTAVVKKPATASTVSTPAAAPSAVPTQSPTEKALGLVLPNLRAALVNIICLPKNAGTLKGISGSGVIISPNGVVLTAAHVAQFALIAETRPDLMTCYIRTGSPASFAYNEAPVYVSSDWVTQNQHVISSTDPTGTGQNDYGLLAITSSGTSAPVPSSFAYVPLSTAISSIGDPVVIGSYGAEFLTTARIKDDLFPTLVYDTVHDRFTFDTNTVDLISLGGGAAAQQGSSGGGVANQNGQLVGLITTSSSGTDLASRDLHAITSTYLLRAFKQESGNDLTSYVTDTNSSLVNAYAAQAKSLANTLLKANNIN